MSENTYSVKEFSESSSHKWDNMLSCYADYNIYQTFGWGEFKKGQGWSVLRLICYNCDRDIALLQCLYRYYKFLRIYIVWIPGGPVFLKDALPLNLESLRCLLTAVLNQFKNKGYYVRIYPMQNYDSGVILSIREMGFQRPIQSINYNFTYHINTALTEKETLDGLTSNWKHNFRRALNEGLTFKHSDSLEDLSEFYKIYLQMADKNKMKAHYSIKDIISIKNNLPPLGSLNLFLSMRDKTILSGRIIGVVAKKAYDLLAAGTYEGRKRYSSHFLIWGIINWCREKNIEYLDMSGVDPFGHKGIFNFKKGIGGNFIEHIGEWEFSNNWFLRLMVNFYISKFLKD